ncbi:hypothetical protein D3C72_2555070 [compost metagenome]
MFSALKKQGVDEVAQLLWQWAHPVPGAEAAPSDEPALDADSTDDQAPDED